MAPVNIIAIIELALAAATALAFGWLAWRTRGSSLGYIATAGFMATSTLAGLTVIQAYFQAAVRQ